MPIYDYRCPECGNVEEDVTVTLDQLDTHQILCVCGEVMCRVIGSSPVILKGSCWAKDGYSRTLGDKWKAEGSFEDTKKR